MIRTAFFALLTLMVLTPAALAKGIEVGKTIPAITAKDQNNKEQSFDSLKGTKGLTIVFVRSVEWCPFCQRQVMDLSENAKKFKDAGYPIVTISYDSVDKLTQFAAKFKTDLPLLSDPRSEIIKSFGIFNSNYAKGTMAYGTPFPGVYVVSADKTVKAKFFKEGVQDRPTVSELLASMKEAPAPVPAEEEFPQETPAAPIMPEASVTDPVAPAVVETPAVVPATAPAVPDVAPAPEAPALPSMGEVVPPAPATPEAMPPAPAVTDGASVDQGEGEAMEYMPPTEDDMPMGETGTPGGL